MTVKEAAELLEISERTVYDLCRAGKLAHYRVGVGRRSIRLEPADVRAYRESRRVAASPDPEPAGAESPGEAPRPRGLGLSIEDVIRKYGIKA